ncbi:MAG: DUF4105 domain-containing protein [Desulfuromonadales bacterium]|nr:MAG: DUF4105 domain-containing protein [Desulfuromonadales bacterium]
MPDRSGTRQSEVYGAKRPVYLFFALLTAMIVAVGAPCALAEESMPVEAILARATAEAIHRERPWQILLHYKPSGSESPRSLVDDPKFFLAPDGKTNPAAELDATLRGLFQAGATEDDTVRCRFPARAAWLQERLGIPTERLPPVACDTLAREMAAVDPQRTVLVFPAAYLNNPASMFGHTFLRVDSGYQSPLLGYAVNYSAHPPTPNDFLYSFKGILGFYPGYYSLLPYYEKVKEYTSLEHRDIWEYPLNLTPEETRRLALHVWELQGISSDYYFFDENCSFNILFLIEAARPTVNLTDRLPLWVIPSDTVRAVQDAGLVAGALYRPAQATLIRHLAAQVPREAQVTALAVARGEAAPESARDASLSAPEQGRTLELAAEFLQYRYARKELEKEEFNRRFLEILRNRSALGAGAGDALPVVAPTRPDQGHRTGRGEVAVGVRQREFFTELAWRPAYHDLLDPSAGYSEGAQINFLDTSVRVYPRKGQLRLQRLRVLDILSLSPRDLLFKPVSWKVNTGLDRETMADGNERLIIRLNAGGGLAYAIDRLGLVHVMAEADLNLSDRLRDKVDIGVGGSVGFVREVAGIWKVALTLKGFSYPLFEEHTKVQAILAQNVRITTNTSLEVSLTGERTFGYDRFEGKMGWKYFF